MLKNPATLKGWNAKESHLSQSLPYVNTYLSLAFDNHDCQENTTASQQGMLHNGGFFQLSDKENRNMWDLRKGRGITLTSLFHLKLESMKILY